MDNNKSKYKLEGIPHLLSQSGRTTREKRSSWKTSLNTGVSRTIQGSLPMMVERMTLDTF